MTKANKALKYIFTVEGETEKWYLKWLEQQINASPECHDIVVIDARVETNPMKFAKSVNPYAVSKAVHLCDYESNDAQHVKKFQGIIGAMKESREIINHQFQYTLGYSNFSFELWIVLHKLN